MEIINDSQNSGSLYNDPAYYSFEYLYANQREHSPRSSLFDSVPGSSRDLLFDNLDGPKISYLELEELGSVPPVYYADKPADITMSSLSFVSKADNLVEVTKNPMSSLEKTCIFKITHAERNQLPINSIAEEEKGGDTDEQTLVLGQDKRMPNGAEHSFAAMMREIAKIPMQEKIEFVCGDCQKRHGAGNQSGKAGTNTTRNRKTKEQLRFLVAETMGETIFTLDRQKELAERTGLSRLQVYKWIWDHITRRLHRS